MKGYDHLPEHLDEHIHTIVKAAARKRTGLVALGLTATPASPIDKIIGRFRTFLCDDVTRVGREPLRKLSAGDRLVRPISARRYGIGTPDLLGVGALH